MDEPSSFGFLVSVAEAPPKILILWHMAQWWAGWNKLSCWSTMLLFRTVYPRLEHVQRESGSLKVFPPWCSKPSNRLTDSCFLFILCLESCRFWPKRSLYALQGKGKLSFCHWKEESYHPGHQDSPWFGKITDQLIHSSLEMKGGPKPEFYCKISQGKQFQTVCDHWQEKRLRTFPYLGDPKTLNTQVQIPKSPLHNLWKRTAAFTSLSRSFQPGFLIPLRNWHHNWRQSPMRS